MKWLALIGLVAFVLWWFRSGGRRPSQTQRPQSSPPSRSLPSHAERAELVRCGVCGLCLPESEALGGEQVGMFYCCPAHRDDARRTSGR